MGVRTSGLSAYGFKNREEKAIIYDCRPGGKVPAETVLRCAIKSNEDLAVFLTFSIIFDVSFDRLDTIRGIPINKVDFYAYRRLALAHIRDEVYGAVNWSTKKRKAKIEPTANEQIPGQMDIYEVMKGFENDKK